LAIIVGAKAVENLRQEFPDCYHWFGAHLSLGPFFARITRPEWLVLQSGDCWLLTEEWGMGVREVHWFCPNGVKIKALRQMIAILFDTTPATMLVGITPHGHPNERKARIINRAVGAQRQGRLYTLPKAVFEGYIRATEST